MKKSLPQSNAAHLTAPSRRGRKRREQAPALPCKLFFVRVGNGLDRSVKNIKLRGRTQFAPMSREQPKMRSAKLDQNLRAGVETRPYNGAPSADPYKRARGDPLACHSEPIGEESRFVYFYFALLEILRFAQDDKFKPIFVLLNEGNTSPPRKTLFSAENAIHIIIYINIYKTVEKVFGLC